MNKEQFVETKESMSAEDFCEKYGVDADTIKAQNVLTYADGFYIEDFGQDDYNQYKDFKGRYYLLLERSDWITNDLSELEQKLYDWYVDNVDLENDPDT